MQNPETKGMFTKTGLVIKEMSQDAAVGLSGYFAAIQFNWIPAAEHVAVALVTAVVCCAAVHYFKMFLRWFDRKVLKIKDDDKL